MRFVGFEECREKRTSFMGFSQNWQISFNEKLLNKSQSQMFCAIIPSGCNFHFAKQVLPMIPSKLLKMHYYKQIITILPTHFILLPRCHLSKHSLAFFQHCGGIQMMY